MAQFFTCPFLENIKNKEQVWATPFDRDISFAELEHFNKRLASGSWMGLIGFPHVPFLFNVREKKWMLDEEYLNGSNSRYKLNPMNPIRYGSCWFKYSPEEYLNYHQHQYIINNAYADLTFEKAGKLLTTKGYKISSSTLSPNERYAEKTFMAISLINSITGSEYCLLPACLTQRCKTYIEQSKEYSLQTASGIINRALDEFIRRKINPTQKEIVDFLIELIGNKEIYISEEHFIAQVYHIHKRYGYEKKPKITWNISNNNVILCKADFIKDTDVKTILSCI